MDMALNSNARLRALLNCTSIEVTAGSTDQIAVLKNNFKTGMDMHVTSLATDTAQQTVTMARVLRLAGFNPVPHLAVRGIESREALDDFLARLTGEAGVHRVLVIAGDRPKPSGPYPESLTVLRTGLLQRHGIRSVAVAGHPEGHPNVSAQIMAKALLEKAAYAKANGLNLDIITQFAFEAEPIVDYVTQIRTMRVDAPIRVGVAGPANLMTLVRYGMRCGVGNSLRALRKQAGMIGRLSEDTPPDELLSEIVRGTGQIDGAGISGFHFYIFGGLRKTGTWLNATLKALATESDSDT